MFPEFGLLFMALALTMSCAVVGIGGIGVYRDNNTLLRATRSLFLFSALFVVLSFLSLLFSFLGDDFSVQLVTLHSHQDLPLLYKIGATWGSHEGSLLLWLLVLVLWGSLVALRSFPTDLFHFQMRVLVVLGFILFCFLGFSFFTSNAFERLLPIVISNGQELNPLLQDPAMMMHPPLLYLGYVGFAVPFALSMAYLSLPAMDNEKLWRWWVLEMRLWTLLSWAFLSLGIALGSWWAYYELGWGGFWFWDPVENASLLPWLAAVALIHALRAAHYHRFYMAMCIFLAIACFALTLLGTFLVRSGILISVHSFANDPVRGTYLLVFFILVTAISLFLARTRISYWTMPAPPKLTFFSKSQALLLNPYIMSFAALVVLLGTVFPLLAGWLGKGLWSVGAPYFNFMLAPLFIAILPLMGMGTRPNNRILHSIYQGFGALVLSIIMYRYLANVTAPAVPPWLAFFVINIIIWSLLGALYDWCVSNKMAAMAHLGIVLAAGGIAASAWFGAATDVRLVLGESVSLADWRFTFVKEDLHRGANYIDRRVHLAVESATGNFNLLGAKRFYPISGQTLTEAGIDAAMLRDIYFSPGERLADGDWTMRLQYKPFVRFIWLGALLMGLAALGSIIYQRLYAVLRP